MLCANGDLDLCLRIRENDVVHATCWSYACAYRMMNNASGDLDLRLRIRENDVMKTVV